MGKVNMSRLFNPWKGVDFFFQFSEDYQTQKKGLAILHPLINNVINDRREYQENLKKTSNGISNVASNGKTNDDVVEIKSSKKREAFLDTLLTVTKDGQPLTHQEIMDEVGNFIFAGHETTSTCIAYSLYVLSTHPDIQEKVFAEQQDMFSADTSTDPSYQDIQNMSYLDMFVKEVTRLYPSVPFIGRSVTEGFDMNGKYVPVGTNILLFILGTGRNPRVYEDPEKFDPERYVGSKYENIAFSAGPRDCVGKKYALLEVKSYLSKIIRRFVIEPSDDKNYKPQMMAITTLQSANGIQIKLKKR